MLVSEVLAKAADLIEPEGRWTTRVTARDGSGNRCSFKENVAVCFCALGAIFKAGGGGNVSADDYFGNYLTPGSDWTEIGGWNDCPDRTQAEVVAKLREAAELAKEQGK